ncbi:MAG: S46 family peptidase [Deltaproteobacteria bacterium]|nr:S46 family peptidase [Deltaproteobacteria bacterium]
MIALIPVLALLTGPAGAEEGMWTLDAFPSAKVAEIYGFAPDARWLEHVRLSSVRLAGGCSGSFVSPDGLVMTNHHCAHGCVEQLSDPDHDYVSQGFYARTLAEERRCPVMEVNVLVGTSDVTGRIAAATRDLTGEAYTAARKAETARIEKACATSDDVRCDVVSLYHGGRYVLYRYRRHQDVRLVFAPEFAVAFFGGDPYNFTFPRYDYDVSFVRVYHRGKPARVKHWFEWSETGAKEGDLTFVPGHPGRTSRLQTVARLEYERDFALPDRLLYSAELRGLLREFMNRGPEAERTATGLFFGVENGYKARRGRLEALQDPRMMAEKIREEEEFRAAVDADPVLRAEVGDAWSAIADALVELRTLRTRLGFLEQGRGFLSDLFDHARTLVRAAEEAGKSDDERLPEFTDARRPAVAQSLLAPAPVHEDLEIAILGFSLTKLRETLGAEDPIVKRILGDKSPDELATGLVKGTKLADPDVRRTLWEGGKAAVDASDDPMIQLAREVDPDARAIRKTYEDRIESTLDRNGEILARAWFSTRGAGSYPDATFTLRLSYGAVEGYQEAGRRVEPFTRMSGLFERHTGRPPFALPQRWLDARDRLPPDLPMNLATTNDIIGGNSGSPVLDRDARIVGLVFDGNLQSLGGDYWFDPSVNRTVSVDARTLLAGLEIVYGADRVAREIQRARR